MWSKDNSPLGVLDPKIFVGKTPDDERLCAFALALGLYFNDSKALIGMTVRLIAEQPKLDKVCEELGEFSALKNYLHRLIYAHIHELHYLLQSHLKEVSGMASFKKIVEQLGPQERKNWGALVAMATAQSDPQKEWFKSFRDGLAFHYVRHKDLYDGYLSWKESLESGKEPGQEGAYISLGSSVKTTRYYFSDAAAAAWMKKEWKKLANGEETLNAMLERNANALSGFINKFIVLRGGKQKRSKYPKL